MAYETFALILTFDDSCVLVFYVCSGQTDRPKVLTETKSMINGNARYLISLTLFLPHKQISKGRHIIVKDIQ